MGRVFVLLGLLASPAMGQSISLNDFAAKVDERADLLGGYEGFLADPDPNRSMAALQIMLESGDDALIRMALDFGIYSPDASVRQTALKAFVAGKPSIDLFFDGSAVTEENSLKYYREILTRYGGSVGLEKRATASFKVGEWNDEMGCYIDQNRPENCLLRVNATTVSIKLPAESYLPAQWFHLELNNEGELTGGVTPVLNNNPVGPLKVTMRLTD